MYYNLLNKNVITLALISLITLGATGTCEAQGVVSLVEEENIVLPQDNTAEDFNDFGIEINAEIPDTLPETDEVIPFDEGIISPAPAKELKEETEPKAIEEDVEGATNELPIPEADENVEDAANELPMPEADEDILPVDQENDEALIQFEEDFDLGLENSLPEEIDAPVANVQPVAPVSLPARPAVKVEQPQRQAQPQAKKNLLVVNPLPEATQPQASKEIFAKIICYSF